MVDEETKKLVERFKIDEDNWDEEEIFSDNFKEFDAYRIYELFSHNLTKKEETNSNPLYFLKTSHLFTINDKVKFTFLNHKPIELTKEDLMLPFDNLFLDVILDCEDTRYFGLHIYFPLNPAIKKMFDREDLFFIRLASFVKKKGFRNKEYVFSLKKGLLCNYEKTIQEKTIEKFLCNLILFLNEPRITIYIREHNNQRRIKQGKIPIPSQIITKIRYDLQEYIERIYYTGQSGSKLGFAFWVRGHKRRLISPRYKEQKVIKIKAYLKGEGLQPPQIHKIE